MIEYIKNSWLYFLYISISCFLYKFYLWQTKINNMKNLKISKDKAGYVLMPYILVEHTEDSLNEYNKFMDEYEKQHECCPKCGSSDHISTLVGYALDMNKKDDYKDLNRCTCMNCSDVHTMHDRIPKKK